jgi:hypothetical protein
MAAKAIGTDRVMIEFGPKRIVHLGSGLQRLPVERAIRPEPPRVRPIGKSAFYKYRRSLSPEGGILIQYRDADRRWRITALRVILWAAMTYAAWWLIRYYSPLVWFLNLGILVLAGIINWWIVRRPIGIARSIEIRSDCMIIDGKDVFWLSFIEDNWPQFQPRDEENPDDQGLYGIYGTRLVEYTTVFRFDDNDCTPETLTNHLQDAMMKLWGDRSPNGSGPRSQ